ncbi:MAG TPA: hypothetical protein VI727_04050 [Candidatus Brocadiaceae bacterium]|nr:hypothetical protein [Candidatus Brocadiaceae bacterium]
MNTKMEAITAIKTLREFMPANQLRMITDSMRGDEKQFLFDKVVELACIIETMPKTYEQDGKGDQAIAYLHYFRGNQDWYITEKDVGTPEEPGQYQAFGQADLGYGGELGYISIVELVAAGIELDLYFEPKTLREVAT